MAGARRAVGIVLKRTKLREQDLIVTLLTDGDTQVRAVAKGARKPGSKLAGVVNLGNEVDVLLHEGKSLDTITEGKLLTSRAPLALDYERSCIAETILEVAYKLTAEGEHHKLLLPLTSAALDALIAARLERVALVGAAYILKAEAMQGYRPMLDVCVHCGEEIGGNADVRRMGFSVPEGGVVCSNCVDVSGSYAYDATLLDWCAALLGMRFEQILALEAIDAEAKLGRDALVFCRSWLEVYPGIRPYALDFAIDMGG